MNDHSPIKALHGIPGRQRGASLFIALIVLLVVTVLALSSAREVVLEARMTGNFIEQQRVGNSAESGLRDGERGVTSVITPLEASPECEPARPCLLTATPSFDTALFDNPDNFQAYSPADGTEPNENTTIQWYALPAPTGGETGATENPEYGNMLNQTGTFRYEINSKAQTTFQARPNSVAILRSTTAKFFDNGN